MTMKPSKDSMIWLSAAVIKETDYCIRDSVSFVPQLSLWAVSDKGDVIGHLPMSAVLIDGGSEYFSILASLSGRFLKRVKYRTMGHAVVLGPS